MNFFDVILIISFWLFVFWGLLKGFIAQLLSLIGLVGSIYFALAFHLQVAMRFSLFSHPKVNRMVILIICFCLPLILSSMLIYLLNRSIKKSPFSFFNRITGGLFGAIKAFLFSVFLIYLLYTVLPRKDFLHSSKLTPYIVEGANLALKMIPQTKMIDFQQTNDDDSQKNKRSDKTI